MRTSRIAAFAAGVMVLGAVRAAPTLQVLSTSLAPAVGDSFTVDLVVDGLTDLAAPSLGVYDFDLTFDPALVAPGTVTFGTGLDVLGLGSIQAATPGAGAVNLFELSLDTIDDLNNLQAGAFQIASVTFTALAAGDNSFGVSVNAFGDADGFGIQNLSVTGQDIRITGAVTPPTGVPEPAALALALAGLGALWTTSRRHRTGVVAPA